MGAGALGITLDDFNGDEFDHTDLDFLHGGSLYTTQTGARPILSNPVKEALKIGEKSLKKNLSKTIHVLSM